MNLLVRSAAALAAAIPLFACAQQEQEKKEQAPPQAYAYSTYFYCDVVRQERASEIMRSTSAPVYDAAVKDGKVIAWGWLAHHTGGQWRRALYHLAPTMEALFDNQQSINEALQGNDALDREFGEICNSHEDYVWQQKAGTALQNRGEVGFSVYFVCDMAKEERADELVETIIGPIYDKHIGEGKLQSWGWLTHIIGGKYRRLATMTAADVKTLLRERGAIIEELIANKQTEEFNEICGSHQDYIWEIELETP